VGKGEWEREGVKEAKKTKRNMKNKMAINSAICI